MTKQRIMDTSKAFMQQMREDMQAQCEQDNSQQVFHFINPVDQLVKNQQARIEELERQTRKIIDILAKLTNQSVSDII